MEETSLTEKSTLIVVLELLNININAITASIIVINKIYLFFLHV